jgi:hypothetical protein
MRVSGHKPVPLDETWSFALGKGTFKQILAQIKQIIE